MRKALCFMTVLLLLAPFALLAGGKSESTEAPKDEPKAAVSPSKLITTPGRVIFYPTLAEYEKATGNKIASFSEAPMLAELVKAGKLPPVDERLPDEPMVVEPRDGIGTYGGRLRCSATSPTTGGAEAWTARTQPILRIVPTDQGDTVQPNVAKKWEISKDFKTITIYLRKGMKWSDGAAYTSDDYRFWHEDIFLNKEISPRPHTQWSPEGTPMQLDVVDDYTVRFNFATPYPSIINVLGYEARMYRRIPFAPKHYLTQFHAKYNKDVAKLAKGEGFENWWQLFSHHYPDEVQQRLDVNVPTVDAWTMTEMDNIGNKYFGRNPYYYKIDTAGNQLPYIDRQDRLFFEGGDLVNLAAIAGGLDYAQQSLITDNYTLYKENAAKGEY